MLRKCMQALLSLLLGLMTLTAPLAVRAQNLAYEAFYVFGDSLSDTGNVLILTQQMHLSPAIPPSISPHKTYYEGRFSNGPVAFEYLWSLVTNDTAATLTPFLATPQLKAKAINFAFGGAGTGYTNQTPGKFYVPGLLGQVAAFQQALGGKKAPAKALYAIWSGANDYLLQLAPPEVIVANTVTNITEATKKLYGLGARNFVVLNLPNLGSVPLIPPEVAPGLTALTMEHNVLLAQSLSNLVNLAGIKIIQVDIYSFWEQVYSSGLKLYAGPGGYCLFIDPTTCSDVSTFNAPDYLFWDAQHPVTEVHRHLSEEIFKALQQY